MDTNNFVKILKALAANYKVMRTCGYALPKPIALLGYEDDYVSQIKHMTNYSLKFIDVLSKGKGVENVLEAADIDFCGIIYHGSCVGKWIEKVREFTIRLYSDSMNEAPPLLVFADGRILNECEEDFFFIYGGNFSGKEILLDEIVPKDEEMAVVMNMVDKIASKGSTQIERVLVAAVCFMYPNLHQTGREDEFEGLVKYAKFLAERSEMGISEGVAEIFIEESYGWQMKTKFANIFKLPQIGMETIAKIDEAIFYDEEFIFISESVFRQITCQLLQIYPENILKYALVREGILKPENTRTYTSKMNYRSIAGTYERTRMLRFQRSKFVKCGELDFVALCLIKEGGR